MKCGITEFTGHQFKDCLEFVHQLVFENEGVNDFQINILWELVNCLLNKYWEELVVFLEYLRVVLISHILLLLVLKELCHFHYGFCNSTNPGLLIPWVLPEDLWDSPIFSCHLSLNGFQKEPSRVHSGEITAIITRKERFDWEPSIWFMANRWDIGHLLLKIIHWYFGRE